MSEASADSQTPPAERRVVLVTRLSRDVYERFEDSLGQPVIDRAAQDSGVDAAYKLGIQFVLKRLRKDLLVDG